MATNALLSSGGAWGTPAFWRELAPALRVEEWDRLSVIRPFKIDERTAAHTNRLIVAEGYFQLPPLDWELPIDDMIALVTKLDAEGIPLPFAFVYDEFWMLFTRLHRVIENLLGPGYLRLPDFWVWLVDPRRGDAGWGCHRDKTFSCLRPDGSPMSVTVWIPLTEATLLNGCMYIVPADRDPTYDTDRQGDWEFDYQDVRALPAEAGSVIVWNQAVLHWGSRGSPRASAPRISAAFEFQAGDIPPFNQPAMPANTIPHFDLRLAFIGKQILQYKHMYPLDPEMKAIAEKLIDGQKPE